MKRRNGDCSKLRRHVRKANRSLDDTYDSMIFILKTLAFWMMTFTVDHFLHIRLEFFWPLWHLACNINSSYKYQGLGLSFVFVCIAFTSDVLCYLFIPVQYLFFAASTWVWVHYIYNNERGLTASTLILSFIIILLESSVKFKPEHRHTLNINLCKPFAAHCIGFPVVTFSFTEIRNNLSLGCNKPTRKVSQDLFSSFDGEVTHKNGSHRKSTDSQDKDLSSAKCHKLPSGNSVEESIAESTSSRCSGGRGDTSSGTAKKTKSHHHNNSSRDESSSCNSSQYKQQAEVTLGLEREVKQLRASLHTSRALEVELRASLASLVSGERTVRSELSEVTQENQELNARLQSLLSARALDKQCLSGLERRLADEKKAKSSLESLLARERRAKASGAECARSKTSGAECLAEACRHRRREMEAETRRERDSQAQAVSRLREEHSELEHRLSSLRSEVSSVQDRNQALERSLSAETRIKLDLFSALGEAKRENEIVEGKLRRSERELSAMRCRLAQVLAVMPAPSHSAASQLLMQSHLDPNAIAYTPKTNGHLIMEA